MRQTGFSRFLFDKWCEDPLNGVVLASYSTEGSFAKSLEANPSEVVSLSNRRLVRRLTIAKASFSGAWVGRGLLPHQRLRAHPATPQPTRHPYPAAHADAAQTNAFVEAVKPPTVMLPYEDELLVRVLGGLAAKRLAAGVKVSGVLVHKNYQFLLMAPADVAKHTPVATHTVAQVQHVPCRAVR